MADAAATTIWIDAFGRTRATYVNTGLGSADIQADLKALSLADQIYFWEGDFDVNPSPAPTTGTYQSVADYAVLIFATAGGDLIYLTLVAPSSSVFLADQETVDPTAIAVLIGDCIGNLQNRNGDAAASYVGGFRRQSGREYQ